MRGLHESGVLPMMVPVAVGVSVGMVVGVGVVYMVVDDYVDVMVVDVSLPQTLRPPSPS
jgi:hypothetical protein